MKPRNPFMERRLGGRVAELTTTGGPVGIEYAVQAIPTSIDSYDLENLRVRMQIARGAGALEEDEASRPLEELMAHGEGAVLCEDPGDRARLADQLGAYLSVYTSFLTLLWRQELALRANLEFPANAPMSLNNLILPSARALSWWEAVLGHRVEATPALEPRLVIRNHRRSVDVTELAATGLRLR